MNANESLALPLLRDISTAVARERNVGKLLPQVLEIAEKRLGMVRGTIALLAGDELRIEASTRTLNAEERALGRYRIGEGITGLVAKTGRAEVVPDVRKDPRFLNRTKARDKGDAVSFVCVPLVHGGQVVGTLSADRAIRAGDRPLEEAVELLGIVANVVGEAASAYRAQRAEREALVEENRQLRSLLSETPGRLIGDCPEMREVYAQIRQVAPTEATVLVRGASGTGKELVARAIQSLSPRKDRPFVVLNCAALPEALVESELFGHERGAFTDARERRIGRAEAADGGTLFLDEIGDLSVPVQVKLLRFLQERTFSRVGSNEERRSDVRFIAAASRPRNWLDCWPTCSGGSGRESCRTTSRRRKHGIRCTARPIPQCSMHTGKNSGKIAKTTPRRNRCEPPPSESDARSAKPRGTPRRTCRNPNGGHSSNASPTGPRLTRTVGNGFSRSIVRPRHENETHAPPVFPPRPCRKPRHERARPPRGVR